jgi:hypothetical protein
VGGTADGLIIWLKVRDETMAGRNHLIILHARQPLVAIKAIVRRYARQAFQAERAHNCHKELERESSSVR